MSKFFIVNDFDRPCEKTITELKEDGRYYYFDKDLNSRFKRGLQALNPTPIKEFGVSLTRLDTGVYEGRLTATSSAVYEDGTPRRWQGANAFEIESTVI